MRLITFIIAISLYSCAGKQVQQESAGLFSFPHFESHLIDSPENPYRVKVCDINQDGLPDIIGLSTEPTMLAWYENPTWEKHPVTGETVNNIDVAVHDIDQDGYPDLAVASNFELSETFREGQIHWLKNPGKSGGAWEIFHIATSPMAHRLLWADIDGNGIKELINAPIVGKGDAPPLYNIPPKIVWYEIPDNPSLAWEEGVIDNELTLVHGIMVVDWNDDGSDDLLTASREGIHLFSFQEDRKWSREKIVAGLTDGVTHRGCSDVSTGMLGGNRFLVSIEPWHGNELVIYIRDGDPNGQWKRNVIDDQLTDGHALATGDLDRDGNDEIMAGYRMGDHSLYCYKCTDPESDEWYKIAIDVGDMAASGVDVADMDDDGYKDIIAAGSVTDNIEWYRSLPLSVFPDRWSENRNLVVVEKGLHQVGFYGPDGEHIKSIPVGKHPHEIVLSADGKTAFVTDNGTMRYATPAEGGHTISIIDLTKMEKKGTFLTDPFRRPHGITIDHKAGLLAVGTENPDRLLLMDAESGGIKGDWDPGGKTPHMNNISEGGEWVYAINVASGNVAAIEVKTGNTTIIDVGVGPQGSAISKDGSQLFVSCQNHLSVIDTKRLEETDRIIPGALRCAITPDNSTLVTASTWKGIGFFDVASHELLYHLQMPFQMFSMTLSADGKYAFASAEPEEISYIISVEERKVVFKFKTIPGSRPDPFYDIKIQP